MFTFKVRVDIKNLIDYLDNKVVHIIIKAYQMFSISVNILCLSPNMIARPILLSVWLHVCSPFSAIISCYTIFVSHFPDQTPSELFSNINSRVDDSVTKYVRVEVNTLLPLYVEPFSPYLLFTSLYTQWPVTLTRHQTSYIVCSFKKVQSIFIHILHMHPTLVPIKGKAQEIYW